MSTADDSPKFNSPANTRASDWPYKAHRSDSPQNQHSHDSSEKQPEDSGMGLLDHLEELRIRLIKMIVAVLVCGSAGLYFGEEILRFIMLPLGETKLHVTEVTGSFYAYLTVSLFAGVIVALPYLFYQLWAFIAPGLYRREKLAILPAIIASTILFLIGAAFCYMVVLPYTMDYLIVFAGDLLTPIITIDSYLSFAGMMILAFGASFELPVLSYFLAKLGIVSGAGLAKGRRFAIVGILIAAGIITPPDVFSQVVLAGPIYLLYEISILVARMVAKR